MTSVLLTLAFDADFSVEEAYEETLERAHTLVGQPGLIWKIWLRDEPNDRAGGAYLFEDRATAEAWAEGECPTARSTSPGLTESSTPTATSARS